ncbi:hypothetical protein AMTRI_Chr07g26280 [Amborella trichopoda]
MVIIFLYFLLKLLCYLLSFPPFFHMFGSKLLVGFFLCSLVCSQMVFSSCRENVVLFSCILQWWFSYSFVYVRYLLLMDFKVKCSSSVCVYLYISSAIVPVIFYFPLFHVFDWKLLVVFLSFL